MDAYRFVEMYQGQPPWDIGRPQPTVVELEQAGQFGRTILDVGCGTGENALFLAERGHTVCGLDYVAVAIERAKAKAAERNVPVEFIVGNALELDRLDRQFDTVLDCGLFHCFSDEERVPFVRGLAEVLRHGGLLHILCFSDAEPAGDGPRRITEAEIRTTFLSGWAIRQIKATRFEATNLPEGIHFSPGGPKAWLVTVERQSS
jgi:SAM-dependent methyltransferase